jgi:oligosaccharide repeat unit polymerase
MTGVSVFPAVLVLLLIGYLLRAAQGRWLTPGPFFAFYWAVGLALPPILAPEFLHSQTAVWYITVLVAAFGLGSLVAGGLRPPVRSSAAEPRRLNLRFLRWLVVFGTGCGVVAFVVIQVANGNSGRAILSGQALLDEAAAFSVARYAGDTQTPMIVPLLLAFTYVAALVAPFAAQGLRRRGAFSCFLAPLTAATLYAVVTTERLVMLVVAGFLFAGWITSSAYRLGEVPRLRLTSVVAAVTAVVVVGGAFVTIAFLRVGSFTSSMQREIWPRLIDYAVGYMPAFAWWLPDSPIGPNRWGTATFEGFVDVGSGESRAFTEFVPLGGGHATTNIFTAWRYLVEDFGFAGAPLAAFAIGWIVTASWKRVVERPTPGPVVAMLGGYAWMLNSNMQTVFLFSNIVLAFVISGWALSRRPAEANPMPVDRRVAATGRLLSSPGSEGPGQRGSGSRRHRERTTEDPSIPV